MSAQGKDANEASASSTKSNGHEDNIKDVPTLPIATGVQKQVLGHPTVARSVMWAGPSSEGSRSESPAAQAGPASDVTPTMPAEPGVVGGAAVAGPDQPKQTRSAMSFANDANGYEGGVTEGHGTEAIDNEALKREASGNDGDDLAIFGRRGRPRSSNVDVRIVSRASIDEAVPTPASGRVDITLTSDEVLRNYGTVRQARARMAEIKAERKTRKDHDPSESTVKDYQGDLRVLTGHAVKREGEDGVLPICAAVAHYNSRSSFYKMRASALWGAREKVSHLLKAQDELQRDKTMVVAWDRAVTQLRVALEELDALKALSWEQSRKINPAAKKTKRSKKSVLEKADSQWRDRFFALSERSDQYRIPCFLAASCGMRPEELEAGVQVSRKDGKVSIRIEGAKVTETAGQPWRQVFIPEERVPAWFLDELSETPRVFSEKRDPMRSYLYRLSKHVFPREGDEPQLVLSQYVLRHCVVTDLIQEGWSTFEVAAVIGERVEETVAHYGLRTRGATWREPDVYVERHTAQTARPVRATSKEFLEKKRALGNSTNQKKKPR